MRTTSAGSNCARVLTLTLSAIAGASLPAQTVHLENFSATPFFGWKRTTVDVTPAHPVGQLADGTLYALGRQLGADARVLDVRVALAPFERRTIDLASAQPS